MESLRKYQIHLFKNQGAWASYNILPIPPREMIKMSANPRRKVYAKRYNKGDRKRYKRRKEMENETVEKIVELYNMGYGASTRRETSTDKWQG